MAGPEVQSQVAEQLDDLGRSIGALDAGVSLLEERLGRVLRDSTPQPEVAGSPDYDVLVVVADIIRNYQFCINGIATRVESISSRLEV